MPHLVVALACAAVLNVCHSKDPDGTMHVLSKGDVEAGLKGWKKSDLQSVKSEEKQAEVCAQFKVKVKVEQQTRRSRAEESKQRRSSQRNPQPTSPTQLSESPSAPPNKRQRTTRGFTAASAASSSSSAASAAVSTFDLLPFDASAMPADGAHFRLSAVPNEWRPDRLPDRADGLSPFMGSAYRYLRNIPFAPINYKLALIAPKMEDQQYNAEWISWTQQQQKREAPLVKQLEEDEFWTLAAQGDTTRMHFKDMEQWYHAKRGASNEDIKFKPEKKKTTHMQRVHNPWRFAQIERQADQSVRDLDAVRVQLDALHVPAICAQQPHRTSLVSADMAGLLGRAWTHRLCDRNSKECLADKPAPEEHQHWIPDCTVFHPVNFSYLPSHPKNLLSLLPHYCRYTWIRLSDGKTHIEQHSMYEFAGLTSGSWYVKCGDDFFYLHIEQLSTWFANFCHEGAMRWYFIAWTQLDGIVRAMLKALARQSPSKVTKEMADSIAALAANSEAEPELRNLIRMLILAKRCLPSIDDLRAEGVQVDIVDQYAGQMMMGDGIVFHQGRSLTPSNIHEAINFIPITWLVRGLPELLATLTDFEMFPAAFKAIQQSKWAWITEQLGRECFLFAHVLVPMEWSFCFLSLLQADLQQHLKQEDDDASPPSRVDYSSLSRQECQVALDQLEQCLDKLCHSDNLYEFYKMAFPTDEMLLGNFRLQLASVGTVPAL